MKEKSKKPLILVVLSILTIVFVAVWWFFIRPPLQWVALEDIAIEVNWQEESETIYMFNGLLTIMFNTQESTSYIGHERIAMRDGIRIRNNRPYVRMRDVGVLNDRIDVMTEADTSAPIGVIVNGLYGQGTEEQNSMIHTLLGNEFARDRFELYFQWYNTIHELGHLITVHHGTYGSDDIEVTRHMVDEELLVNSFAVAFWMYYGEDEKLYALEEMVEYVLSNLTPPVANMSHVDFMREAIDEERFEELFTFEIYGWFQFSLVRDILRERDSLDLAALLIEMTGMDNIQIQQSSQPLAYSALGVDMVPQIVADATSVLRELGVSIPDAYISFSTDPNEHMLQYPMSRAVLEASITTGRLIPAY